MRNFKVTRCYKVLSHTHEQITYARNLWNEWRRSQQNVKIETGASITLSFSVYRAWDCTSPEADAFSKERARWQRLFSRTKDNQSQRVASQCSRNECSATEGLLYKRDEHYRSASSQWEIMHPLWRNAASLDPKENTRQLRINRFASFFPLKNTREQSRPWALSALPAAVLGRIHLYLNLSPDFSARLIRSVHSL